MDISRLQKTFKEKVRTEVYVAGKWIGLDATKNRFFGMSNSFTAGYIALSGIGNKPDLSWISTLSAFKIQHVEQ